MAELLDPLLKAVPAQAGESVTHASGAPDRRRPGRLEQISPALIPVLREPAQYVDADIDTDLLARLRHSNQVASISRSLGFG
jgi:hypothetical protein